MTIVLSLKNQKLRFDQKKLFESSVPWMLRCLTYIRVGCLSKSLSYSKFLNQIIFLDGSSWFDNCYISPESNLCSLNLSVNNLLQQLIDNEHNKN